MMGKLYADGVFVPLAGKGGICREKDKKICGG